MKYQQTTNIETGNNNLDTNLNYVRKCPKDQSVLKMMTIELPH